MCQARGVLGIRVPGKFLFDSSITASGGLTPLLSRGQATVNPAGQPVGPDEPRFGPPVLLAGVQQVSKFDATLRYSNVLVMDSGRDHDGVSELLLACENDGGNLIVYTDPNDPTQKNVTPMSHIQISAASGGLGLANILPMGTDPKTGRNRGFAPIAGCICHGFIAVWCSVLLESAAGGWDIMGSGVLYSVNKGQNWRTLFDDLTKPAQPFMARGNRWSLQKYFTPYYDPQAAGPLEAWLVGTDYRLPKLPQQAALGEASAGRFFLWRITRSAIGRRWICGDGSGVVAILDMEQIRHAPGFQCRHSHAGAIVRWGDRGVRFVGSVGDTHGFQRMVTATLPDHSGSYTRADDWAAADNYHGRAKEPSPEYHPDFGAASFQPVGCLQGRGLADGQPPAGQTIFWGADDSSEAILQMRCPDSGPPTIAYIYGIETSQSTLRGMGVSDVMQLKCGAPERSEAIIATLTEAGEGGATLSPNGSRLLYCPPAPAAGPNPFEGLWAMAATLRSPQSTAAMFGNQIVIAGGQYYGLRSRDVPSLRGLRPLHLNPGGRNLLASGFVFDTPIQSMIPLSRDAQTGAWLDGPQAGPLTPISPQPPGMPAAVYRVTIDSNNPSRIVSRLRISTNSPQFPELNVPGWTLGPRSIVRKLRFHVLDASAGPLSTLPRPSTATFSINLLGDDSYPDGMSIGSVSNSTKWMSHATCFQNVLASPPRMLLYSDRGYATNDSMFYISCEQAREGTGSFGYPMPPGPPFIPAPDEALSVTNLGITGQSFTVLLAGMMPEGDWDARMPRPWSGWPLFTLSNDAGFYAEFSAVCGDDGLQGSFQVVSGSPFRPPTVLRWPQPGNIYWSRCSQLLVALCVDNGRLTAVASLGGDVVRISDDLYIGPLDPTTLALRFQGLRGEVVSFRWAGGQVLTPALDPDTDVPEQFRTLDFLGGF